MPELVSFTVGRKTHKAALSVPAGGTAPFPGVIVIHDAFGFTADLRRHCDRFAEAGYVALGPDLYGGGRPGCVVKTLTSAAQGEGYGYKVINAARTMLAARSDVDPDRIGITGFCLGGGFALIAAADQSFAVAAPFYGATPNRASRLAKLCPTIAQYGAEDATFLPHAKRLARHLAELGIEHEVHIHENAGHSFMNQLRGPTAPLIRRTPLRARYEPEVEAKAWENLLDFFSRHMPVRSSQSRAEAT